MLRYGFISVFTILLLACATHVSHAQIAIVVNKENAINDLSLSDLKQIYLGKKATFSRGKNIALAEQDDLKEDFYRMLLGWSVIKIKKHWMRLIFSGESSAAPRLFRRTDKLKDYVLANENAIAFIDLAQADDRVRILAIDGKKTGNKDYPFKHASSHRTEK